MMLNLSTTTKLIFSSVAFCALAQTLAMDGLASTDWRTNKTYKATFSNLPFMESGNNIDIDCIEYNNIGILKFAIMQGSSYMNDFQFDVYNRPNSQTISNSFQPMKVYSHISTDYVSSPTRQHYQSIFIKPKEKDCCLDDIYMNEETDMAVGRVTIPRYGLYMLGSTYCYLLKTHSDTKNNKIYFQPIMQLPELDTLGSLEKAVTLPDSNTIVVFSKSSKVAILKLSKYMPTNLLTFKQDYDLTFIYT